MNSNNTPTYLCSLLVFFAACGEVVPIAGTETDADPGEDVDAMVALGPCEGDAIALEDLTACFVKVQCEWLVTCQFIATTVEACVELYGQQVGNDLQRTIESVDESRTAYDGEAAAECLAAVTTATCSDQPGEDCDTVFIGTIPEGGVCYNENECEGVGARCADDYCPNQCCPGSCIDAAPLGGNCVDNRPCVSGAECVFIDGAAIENQCLSGELDSPCEDSYQCDSGLYCGTTKSCEAALLADQVCDQNSQCLDPLTCVGESDSAGTCRLVNTVGASCDTSCDGSLFCERTGQATTGSCSPPLQLGGMCESDSNCQTDLYCREIDRTCQARGELNMPCESYGCVQGLFCSNELPNDGPEGTCAEPVINGLECDRDSHCESNICSSNVCEAYMSCF